MGAAVGSTEGTQVGQDVGTRDGIGVGAVGVIVGITEDGVAEDGVAEGSTVGTSVDGVNEGRKVGSAVGEGATNNVSVTEATLTVEYPEAHSAFNVTDPL